MLHLTSEEVATIVRKNLGKDGVQVVGVDVRPYKEGVAGFMGSHHKIRIRVLDQNRELSLEFFAKTFDDGDSVHSRQIRELRSFEKETELYESAIPEMTSEDGGKWAPQFYLAKQGLLVLEDLALSGFRTVGAMSKSGLDLRLVRAALETLARFHAASFVVERRRALPMNQLFPLACQEFCFNANSKLALSFYNAFKQATSALCDLIPKYGKDCRHHEAIKALIPVTCDQLFKMVHPSKVHRNAICHTDVWLNNFLFREDAFGGAPEARLVDFQLIRYIPPAYDVALLLCLVLSRETRHQRTEELLRHYYGALVAEMQRRSLVQQDELTWEQFRLSYDEYIPAGLITACVNHQISMLPSTTLADLAGTFTSDQFVKFWFVSRDEQVKHFYYNDENYRRWVTEDLEELIEVCILPLVHAGAQTLTNGIRIPTEDVFT